MRSLTVVMFVAIFVFISELSGPVHAYLDPGTGSMVLQVILGTVVGGLALVRIYWRRLVALVSRRRRLQDGSLAE